ncbi:MAG TPA: PAS domain S-box protein, partial [Roseimicrobium sp.]|nr:PAS domain S-box protein [Roseimicrobium sp.]
MGSESLVPTGNVNEEIATLIETMLASEQRLEQLTAGEVDTLTGRDGQTFLLRRAQEQLRHNEAGKEAAILNALPAHIALLDDHGVIISTNESWQRFAGANMGCETGKATGINYLDVCDRAKGGGATDARQVAEGIRAVLSGREKVFSMEYPCHSPTEQRWFLMRVNPLSEDRRGGAVVMHINITERKLAEEFLKASEASMALAQRIAHIGSWELELTNANDTDRGALIWSDESFRIAGFEPGEVEVSNGLFFGLVHPDDRQPVKEAVAKAIRERREYSIVHRLVRPSGDVRTVHEIGRIFFEPETWKPLKIVGMTQDVTERYAAEQALRTSLEEFRTLSEAMTQIVWVTAPDGRNIYVNRQWADYTGLSTGEGLGKGWLESLHPEDSERVMGAWRQASASNTAFSTECRMRRADGVYRWWLARAVAIKDSAGTILKWIGTSTDIDELKQAQIRVGEQAEFLDASHEAIVVMDLEDRIIFWNKGAERIYGHTSGEAMGRKSMELLYKDAAKFAEARAVVLRDGEWDGEMHKRTKDGTDLTVDARWSLVRDGRGRPKSVLSINSDITEKKKLEGQYLRSQRMESIGTLAGGVAHDLNNVLAPILMAVEILKDSVKDENGLALLGTLESSAQRGAELVKQVLSFARGVEGRRIGINPLHVMRDLVKIMRETFPKTIKVDFTAARDLWTVTGDPTQMHQVFMNLCVNARDAMPRGGKISVSMENVVLDESYAAMSIQARPGAYMMVKVEDTGTGIPRAIQDKIFEPFFTTKEIGKGTGLGLSTTMAIVRSHGGFIHLYSEVG